MAKINRNHMRSLAAEEAAIREELANIREEIENLPEEEEEEEGLTCTNCGCSIEYDCEVMWDDDPYCMDCVVSCEYCGDYVPDDVAVVANRHLRWEAEYTACPSCAEEHFSLCDGCEEWITSGGIWREDGDIAVCTQCEDNYAICTDCGSIVLIGNAYFSNRRGVYYCESCWDDDDQSDNISEYGHDQFCHDWYGNRYFHETDDECDVKRYFGVEMEVDYGNDRNELADDLFSEVDNADDLFKCKTDGSLNREGLEIVTFPCSFLYMMQEYPFDEIAGIAVRNGYRSHDTSACGLHVHVSRAGLGETEIKQDLTVAKLMILFDRFWDKLVNFSRRDISQIDDWAKKPDLSIYEEDDDNIVVSKSKEYRDRYQAINLHNSQTVEFRLFRGTLKVSTIKATIQFLEHMINFVMCNSLRDCMKCSWHSVFGTTPYTELNEYLAIRNLI